MIQFYGLTDANGDTNSNTDSTTVATQLWNFTTTLAPVSLPLVVDDDYIYAFGPGMYYYPPLPIYCINASTGAQIWSHTIDTAHVQVHSMPTVAYGRIFIGTYDDGVICLDAYNGTKLWTFANGLNFGPTVAQGYCIYAQGRDLDTVVIYALRASTGTEVWNYSAGIGDINSIGVVSDDVIYAVTRKYVEENQTHTMTIHTIDAFTGDKIWQVSMSDSIRISSPGVVDGRMYMGSIKNVYCLDAITGATLWNNSEAGTSTHSPVVANGCVYISSQDGNIYALNSSTGTIMWNYVANNTIATRPVLDNEYLYFCSSNNVYCLESLRGTKVWSFETDRPVQDPPTITNGKIYVGSSDRGGWDDKCLEHNLYALDALTGNKIWNYTFQGSIDSSVIVDKTVYVAASYVYIDRWRTKLDVKAGIYALEQTTTFTPNPTQEPEQIHQTETIVYLTIVVASLSVACSGFLIYTIKKKKID